MLPAILHSPPRGQGEAGEVRDKKSKDGGEWGSSRRRKTRRIAMREEV